MKTAIDTLAKGQRYYPHALARLVKQSNAYEFTEFDINIIRLLSQGYRQNEIPDYLKNHNMEWNGGAVRQKPGPSNSLGLVKFLFPNSYNIYLHDSPAKSLFKEDKRAFSHGCIRVSQAKFLAKWLLRDYPEWTDEKITSAMNAGKEQYFTLKETVPVFIAYFTSWVDRQGELNFREDIYKRDNRLAQAIMEKPRI